MIFKLNCNHNKKKRCKCHSFNDLKHTVKKNSDFKNGLHNSALMLQATVPGWSETQENLELKM